MLSPQQRRITIAASEYVPAHTLTAHLWHAESDETVLCMHGLTRNSRDFDFLAEALLPRYRVVALDMPGRGGSDVLASALHYHYGTYLADTLSALSQLGMSRVHWVGTSMGGILGMMACAAAPGLVASMVLNDIGCLIPASGLSRILSYAGSGELYATRGEAEAALRRNCEPFGIVSEHHWQHLFTHSIIERDGRFGFAYDANITALLPKDKPVEDVNLWALMDSVKSVPTLLLRGEKSDILLRDTARAMQAQHPQLHFEELAGCGHAPALMDETQTALIKRWLSEHSN